MGQQILSMFKEAEGISLQAKMKFVMLTQLTTMTARDIADAPDDVSRCRAALETVKAELAK